MGNWWVAGLALAVGGLLAVQAGANAKLSEAVKSPLAGALLTAVVALVGTAVVAVVARPPVPSAADLGSAPWWAWVGGLVGSAYVLVAILAAHRLGAVALVGFVLAGQLAASVALDHFGLVGFEVRPATAARLAGVALLLVGVYLVQRY